MITSEGLNQHAQTLVAGWIGHFTAADRAIRWLEIEKEQSLWLDGKTLLLGKIDATGETEDGELFFADWKTTSARNKNRMDFIKAEYRLDPQMMTYGLFTLGMGTARFMVRWAIKGSPPTYAHEWYSYTSQEVVNWGGTLVRIADRIRTDRKLDSPWITNYSNCLRYGPNYACPFYGPCRRQDFTTRPPDMVDRVSHLATEREMLAASASKGVFDPELVILDATRIETWLGCNEKYRRIYEDQLSEPPSEALQLGSAFHDLLAHYYTQMRTA